MRVKLVYATDSERWGTKGWNPACTEGGALRLLLGSTSCQAGVLVTLLLPKTLQFSSIPGPSSLLQELQWGEGKQFVFIF